MFRDKFEEYWPEIVSITLAAKKNAWLILRSGLPIVEELIESTSDLKKIGQDLVEMAEAGGENAQALLHGTIGIPDFLESQDREIVELHDLDVIEQNLRSGLATALMLFNEEEFK